MIVGLATLLSSSALLMGLVSQSATQEMDAVTRRQMAISVAAADERMPSSKIIDVLESTLSRSGCVGQISRWSRRYAFGLNDRGALSTDKIIFALKRVHSGIPAVREVVPYRLFPDLDDADFDRVDGYYIPSSKSLKVTYCGPNRGHPSKGI